VKIIIYVLTSGITYFEMENLTFVTDHSEN